MRYIGSENTRLSISSGILNVIKRFRFLSRRHPDNPARQQTELDKAADPACCFKISGNITGNVENLHVHLNCNLQHVKNM